jgi:hypothetical protein
MYDPVTQTTRVVATDIPSDPKDPTRLNNVNPIPLPKDEPMHNIFSWIRDNILIPIGTGAQEAVKSN